MLQRLRNLITVSCFAQLHPLPPLERTSKKGNANKSQINWKAKKKKSMRPLTLRRRGEVIIWFFWGDSFVFLLAGLQSQTAGSLPTSTGQQPLTRCYYRSSPGSTQTQENLPGEWRRKFAANWDSVRRSRLKPASARPDSGCQTQIPKLNPNPKLKYPTLTPTLNSNDY